MGRKSGLVWKLGGTLLILAALVGVYLQQSRQALQRQEELRQLVQQTEQGAPENPTVSTIKVNQNTAEPTEENVACAGRALSGELEADILVTPEQFAGKVALSTGYSRGTYASALLDDLNAQVQPEDILVLEFQASSDKNLTELDVYIGQTQNHIFVGKTPASYYIPVSGQEKVEKVAFALTSKGATVTLDRLYLTNYGDRYPIEYIKTGVFSMDNVEPEEIASPSLTKEPSNQCLVDGDYLYSINNGSLHVYRLLEDGKTEKVATLGGMAITRDMAFNSDRTALVITSRQNGAFLIDISNPEKPVKSSHYDTLEAATGVAVSGDYAFLCSRRFGIEIVDISDIDNPVYVNKVSGGSEYQDCFVDGEYLYVGVYGDNRIDIYNIKNLGTPNLVSKIQLNGAGQGCYVRDGILYAATALNSDNSVNGMADFKAGTGNGLEIFDVSDPREPERLSVVKLDGRFGASGCSFRGENITAISDVWDVQVSGKYAYMSSMFQGVIVIDVSAPEDPKIVKQFLLTIPPETDGYAAFSDGNNLVNWDWTESGRGCAFHVALADQKIYTAMTNKGVYCLEWDEAAPLEEEAPAALVNEKTNDTLTVKGYTVQEFSSNGSVWAVTADDKYIYVACGDEGLAMLDQNLNLVDTFKTETSVRDVKLYGEYLYTAESEGGIGVYKVEDAHLVQVSVLPNRVDSHFASQLQVTADGSWLLAQLSTSNYSGVTLEDPAAPKWQGKRLESAGSMYYRNLSSTLTEQGLIAVAGKRAILWYTAEEGELVLKNSIDNTFYREAGGMTAVGAYSLIVTNNGIVVIDPETGEASPTFHFGSLKISGKPCAMDGLLVISDSPDGRVTMIDISNLENPLALGQLQLDCNPDIAFIRGDTILLPCRRGGLLKITADKDK